MVIAYGQLALTDWILKDCYKLGDMGLGVFRSPNRRAAAFLVLAAGTAGAGVVAADFLAPHDGLPGATVAP